jgi:uncharacterized protein (TIGR02996 family)
MEIERGARSFVVTWGKKGTRAKEKKHAFKSAALAAKAYDRLVARKLAEGYRDVGALPAPPGTLGARNPELEAAIRVDRADPGPYEVYADWLQAHGNPLGELIVVQRALDAGKDARAAKRAVELTDGLGLPGVELATCGWKWGLWSWLRLENSSDWMDEKFDAVGFTRQMFAFPMCAGLEELRIGILRWDFNYTDVPAAIAEAGTHAWSKDLVRLRLGDVEGVDMAHHVIGDVGKAISKAFPRLRSLFLHSGEQSWRDGAGETFGVAKLALPELVELTVETCSLSKQRLKHLLAAELPNLERLELWFGSEDYGANCTAKDLQPLLGGAVFPKLRHLGLRNAEFANAIAAALPGAAIAKRLESIDLSMGTMTDDGALALAAKAAAFPTLKTLSIDDNFLGPEAVRAVRTAFAGKDVVSTEQKDADRSIPEEVHYYVSVSE